MKTFLTLALFIFLSSFTTIQSLTPGFNNNSALSLTALSSETFVRFNAHRHQKGVALSWTINPSAPVSGFIIERSYDGFYFDVIDEVQATDDDTYRYKDEQVYPGYLYYKITAVSQDGTSSESLVEMVRIVRNG